MNIDELNYIIESVSDKVILKIKSELEQTQLWQTIHDINLLTDSIAEKVVLKIGTEVKIDITDSEVNKLSALIQDAISGSETGIQEKDIDI